MNIDFVFHPKLDSSRVATPNPLNFQSLNPISNKKIFGLGVATLHANFGWNTKSNYSSHFNLQIGFGLTQTGSSILVMISISRLEVPSSVNKFTNHKFVGSRSQT